MSGLLIQGASIVDGTGKKAFVGDVAVSDCLISEIGRIPAETGSFSRVIDARGLTLTPGFIDMHAHSELAVLSGAAHDAKIRQGVTTEVLGQDGLGYAPLDDAAAAVIPAQIAGWNGMPAQAPWRTMDDLLAAIDAAAVANAAVSVASSASRGAKKPFTPRRTMARSSHRML